MISDLRREWMELLYLLKISLIHASLRSTRNIVMGCIYITPNSSIKEFKGSFSDLLYSLNNENKDVYLLGDFNIDIDERYSYHMRTHNFKTILSACSFTPVILKHTRITSHSATCLDNIFTNVHSQTLLLSGVFATQAYSDNFPIFGILRKVSQKNEKITIKRRNICQKNISKF